MPVPFGAQSLGASRVNEADTCRKEVVPRLVTAGWDNEPHSFTEQRTFTDGRIIPLKNGIRRGKQKRADFILRYRRDLPIAVIEAKAEYKTAGQGLQQAKDYAEILGLKFAYATNGKEIIEFDFLTGLERTVTEYPSPPELFSRFSAAVGLDDAPQAPILEPYNLVSSKLPRYYQDIAINRTVEEVVKGQRRILLTMATGTGKTATAFQICWKLWNSRWNKDGEYRRPRILYLADRNVLVDDPMNRDFSAFGDAAIKIESGETPKSREIYFAIYQAIAEDENRPGLFREYPADFFDVIIVDECHRGSARKDSTWREILQYFSPAVQIGMTATPLRDDNRDTYKYFGNPLYSYSLRQGIEDGFLAPYRVTASLRLPTPPDGVRRRGSWIVTVRGTGRRVPHKGFRTGGRPAGTLRKPSRSIYRSTCCRPTALPRPSSSAWIRSTPTRCAGYSTLQR